MKAKDEFIRTLPSPSEAHVAAVTQAISDLMSQVAATELSYHHRAEIFQYLEDVVYAMSRGCHRVLGSLSVKLMFIIVTGVIYSVKSEHL